MIVEDDALTREGLALLINVAPGYECIATFGSVEEALPRVPTLKPDVLLLDIGLPGTLGSVRLRETLRVLQHERHLH